MVPFGTTGAFFAAYDHLFALMRVGLISDTHGWLDPKVFEAFADCDELWHAGDIGSVEVAQRLEAFKPLRAVHGNIDAAALRARYPAYQRFSCGGLRVLMTHIGSSAGRHSPQLAAQLHRQPADLLVTGHTHMLRVGRDSRYGGLLQLNPGAAGHQGIHQVRTLLRFTLQAGKLTALQVVELGPRGGSAARG